MESRNERSGSLIDQRGFTLVEMAIVLVVIGLILGAVTVGTNLVRDAEYAKIGQKFVMAWKNAYDVYYKRTGVVIGDCQIEPTYMVDGQEARFPDGHVCGGTVTAANAGAAGIPKNFTKTGLRICNGQGYVANAVGVGDPQLATINLRQLMQKAGVRMPAGRAEGKEDRYLYQDSNGNAVELQVCFQWNPEKTNSGAGNVMVLRGLTPDLARMLDQMIDGKADALEGRFRQQDAALNTTSTANQPGHEWVANNTYAQPSTGANVAATAQGVGQNKDENRVALVTAHWIMDE